MTRFQLSLSYGVGKMHNTPNIMYIYGKHIVHIVCWCLHFLQHVLTFLSSNVSVHRINVYNLICLPFLIAIFQ